MQRLSIKTPSLKQLVRTLSGGNQQKVVMGKWLAAGTRILLLDEPTRGIDINAKFEIYQLMRELAGKGMSVIMVSSGFPGVSQTLTLLVHARYIDDHNTYGAYAAATLLMGIALVVLLLMTVLDRKRSNR